MALLEAGLSRKVYIKMGGKSMAGMGASDLWRTGALQPTMAAVASHWEVQGTAH